MSWTLFLQIVLWEFLTTLMVLSIIQTWKAGKEDGKDK